jgi:hypothetical protein
MCREKIKRGNFDEKRAPRMFHLYFMDMARDHYSKNMRPMVVFCDVQAIFFVQLLSKIRLYRQESREGVI